MSPGDAFDLVADELHVWYVFGDKVDDPRLLESYIRLMAPDERARHDRFVFAKDRHQFLVTRGLVRTLLARYGGLAPEDCVFETNRYGRPSLCNQRALPIAFNLSHTHGIVACAVVRGRDVGLDVEDLDRPAINPALPARYFSPAEGQALDEVAPHERMSRFFDYWTLKEAYIKARGMGLSLPLAGFSLLLEDGRAPRISFASTIEDDPAAWQFALFDPSPRYRLAVAVRRRGPDLSIRLREFDPVRHGR